MPLGLIGCAYCEGAGWLRRWDEVAKEEVEDVCGCGVRECRKRTMADHQRSLELAVEAIERFLKKGKTHEHAKHGD